MRVSLNICPEVRRRLPFSFSFAYGVHCECAPRGNRDAIASSTVQTGSRWERVLIP